MAILRKSLVVAAALVLAGCARTPSGGTAAGGNGPPIGDKNPGDINGQGLRTDGGRWYLLDPSGNALTTLTPPTQSGPGGY